MALRQFNNQLTAVFCKEIDSDFKQKEDAIDEKRASVKIKRAESMRLQ